MGMSQPCTGAFCCWAGGPCKVGEMLTVFGAGFVQEHVQPNVSIVHSSAAFVPDTNESLKFCHFLKFSVNP